MEGLEGLFAEPNGPAYQKREERFGPPLGYAQEKMASSLRSLHDLIQSIDEPPRNSRRRRHQYRATVSTWLNRNARREARHLRASGWLPFDFDVGEAEQLTGLRE